jgi:DNA primase small subunit
VAKTVPLDPPTLAWARGEFARYYRDAVVEPPSRLARREFAAFPFASETMMRRHATLPTPRDLAEFLAREVPRHVYYSTAYYRRPAEPTMAAKEWLGADLIFDLDSDHLRGAESLDYPGQLALVKRRLVALVDDFLFGDFGIDPAATSFVFSGGRGYHVHVRDDRFVSLTSPERRELVDYVLGTGVDPMRAIERHAVDARSGPSVGEAAEAAPAAGRARRAPGLLRLAPPDAPGWKGRTTRAVLASLARWRLEGPEVAAAEMTRAGVKPPDARRWARRLLSDGVAERIERTLELDVFRGESAVEFVRAIVPQATIAVQGETDAPVTTDIHRLIRLPGSLHGGTGLRVVPLTREAIDRFDPFSEALLPAPPGARTPVTFREEVAYPFPDGGVRGHPGATEELPTPLALFLVLRGEAELRPSPT